MYSIVLGLGKSGKAAKELLEKNGYSVDVYDKNKKINEINFSKDYLIAVISPGVSGDKIISEIEKRDIPIISEIELAYRYVNFPTVAVTGTNGKSTVVKLIKEMLCQSGYRAEITGNFGYPYSLLCERTDIVAVLEASSFQLERVDKFSPDVAVITNITPDHMDRYDSFDSYVNAKKNIFKNQLSSDLLIANYDDITVREIVKDAKSKVLYFSRENKVNGCYLDNGCIVVNRGGKIVRLIDVSDLYSSYPFEIENCLCALTFGLAVGLGLGDILSVVKNYNGLKHRLDLVGEYGGKRYYDNSKATNVASCLASVNAINGNIALILGGSSKNEDFKSLFEKLPKKVKYIAVCGANSESIIKSSGIYNTITKKYADLESIIQNLATMEGIDAVIYAPSSASFDKYSGFEERGEVFCSLVKKFA